jgi:hypothetical protein
VGVTIVFKRKGCENILVKLICLCGKVKKVKILMQDYHSEKIERKKISRCAE